MKPTHVGRYIDLYREICGTTPILNNQEAEVIRRLVEDAPAPEAQPQITRITIPPNCTATGQIFMTMKLSAGEWYCHGCGANQSEPACRFSKSVPL